MESPDKLADDRRSADWRDIPSRTDPWVTRLSSVAGGPLGRHALVGRARFWTPVRVLFLLTVAFLALGWFVKAPCIQQAPDSAGELGLDWSGHRPYVALCYSDIVPLYGAELLNRGEFPYKSSWVEDGPDGKPQVRHMEYPVVSGLYQYGSMAIGKGWQAVSFLPQALDVVVYFTVVVVGLSLFWLLTVWATALLAGRRIWDAALVACSPLVIVHIFTNFDAIATGLAAAGMLAWARKKPMLAGILLGIGGAAKLYPMFLLLPLLLVCFRAQRMRPWVETAVAAVAAWVLVNLPIAILFRDGWLEFFRLNSVRGQDPDSIYNVISSFSDWPGLDGHIAPGATPVVLNTVSALLFVVVCAAISVLALKAEHRPRIAQLAFLLVAGFLLTNKVWSPQFSLWLVPLAVLAIPNKRLLLGWMTIDALVWVPRMMYYLGVDNKGLPEQWFTGAVIIRDIAVVGLCVLVVRQVLRPETDPVRFGWIDDPGGGVVAGEPDRLPSWLPRVLTPRSARPSPEVRTMDDMSELASTP